MATSPLSLLFAHIPSPLGTILLVSDGEGLRALDFLDYEDRMHRLLRRYCGAFSLTRMSGTGAFGTALAAYFDGDLTALDDLPVRTGGTPFQTAIWTALRKIPAGTTMSYGGLAKQVGRPAACRAAGLANGANPVAIVVPCHRVIGADGRLTGYGGGLARKEWLLRHESAATGWRPR